MINQISVPPKKPVKMKNDSHRKVEWVSVPYVPQHQIIWTWISFLGLVAATKHEQDLLAMLAFGIVFGLAFYIMRTKEISLLFMYGTFLMFFALATELTEVGYLCMGPLFIPLGKEVLYW